MKFKAVIFDLDGVICSTDEYHYLAWKALADIIGVTDFTREDNKLQRGVSRMESLEVVLKKSSKVYSDEQKVTLAETKNDIYKNMLAGMSEKDLDGGVSSTLNALRGKGLKLAIGSSSKNTPFILERLGLGNFFDAVADGNCVTHSKPDPEVFLKAAEYLNIQPCDCLVVEDAVAGVNAGIAGGFKVAGLGEASKYSKTTYPVNKFSDLLKVID